MVVAIKTSSFVALDTVSARFKVTQRLLTSCLLTRDQCVDNVIVYPHVSKSE